MAPVLSVTCICACLIFYFFTSLGIEIDYITQINSNMKKYAANHKSICQELKKYAANRKSICQELFGIIVVRQNLRNYFVAILKNLQVENLKLL